MFSLFIYIYKKYEIYENRNKPIKKLIKKLWMQKKDKHKAETELGTK